MIHIRDIDHVVLRVVDLPAMLRFYCDGLGCRIERRQDEIGLIQLRAGRSMVDLVPLDAKEGEAAPAGLAVRAAAHGTAHESTESCLPRFGSAGLAAAAIAGGGGQ